MWNKSQLIWQRVYRIIIFVKSAIHAKHRTVYHLYHWMNSICKLLWRLMDHHLVEWSMWTDYFGGKLYQDFWGTRRIMNAPKMVSHVIQIRCQVNFSRLGWYDYKLPQIGICLLNLISDLSKAKPQRKLHHQVLFEHGSAHSKLLFPF